MEWYKVSKMGDSRIVILPSAKFTYGDKVVVKPKGIDLRLYLNITKSGKKIMAIIPKKYWDYFPHRSDVMVKRWETKR